MIVMENITPPPRAVMVFITDVFRICIHRQNTTFFLSLQTHADLCLKALPFLYRPVNITCFTVILYKKWSLLINIIKEFTYSYFPAPLLCSWRSLNIMSDLPSVDLSTVYSNNFHRLFHTTPLFIQNRLESREKQDKMTVQSASVI